MVERSAICHICGGLAKPAYTCKFCGAVCCEKCFREDLGVCSKCATKARR